MTKRAQTTLEACFLIILVALAWLAMQGFFKRSLQANWRTSADAFSDEQYNGDNMTVNSHHMENGQPAIVFKGSNISANKTEDDSALGTFNVAALTTGNVMQITGWGTYASSEDDDDE